MTCPDCGTPVPADAGHCTKCGAPVAATRAFAEADAAGLPPDSSFGGVGAVTGAVTGGVAVTGWENAVTADTRNSPPLRHSGGPLSTGQSFSARYHIIRLLGAGGMGAVYQAWDAELAVAVALKVIRRDDQRGMISPEAEKRFKTELLLARQVTHKNVVRIHDLGEIDGIKYITMPYIQGDDLATVLRNTGKLPIARALRLMRQIADGLHAAHEAGVVHRDLKPANIMVSTDDHAWIMDFGISASTNDASSGGVMGTPEYMAPEQAIGEVADARADIYALGLISHELLIGPRSTSSAPLDRLAAMERRLEEGLPSVSALNASIPLPLGAIVTRCLERDPAARFQTTAELRTALAGIDDDGGLIPVVRRLTPRVLTAAAVLVIALLVGTSLVTRRAVQPAKQHDPVSVVIADFENRTGDSTFDGALEPMLKRAMEGAGFISAYDRNGITRTLGVRPPDKLNEAAARELAVKQGVGVVLSGTIDRQDSVYAVSVKAAQTVTGEVISSNRGTASSRDQVLPVATRLVTAVRTALGDDASESAQQFAMQSLSVTSLDVVRLYAAAQQASSNNKFEEARQHLLKAVEIDPKFGVGYQLLAAASRNVGNLQDAEKYINEALRYLDGMTERERYSTRGMFYRVTGDYPQCVKEYGDLIARFGADVVGHNQRALCLSKLRDMRGAMDEMNQVVTVLPKQALFRVNLAFYSNYAGDFASGAREARTIEEPDAYAGLALAFSQVGQGQFSQAQQTYQRLGALNTLGATIAASGLGDLATVEGRFSDAVQTLTLGAAQDLKSKNSDRAAAKLAAAAHAELLRGHTSAAVDAADKALTNSKAVQIRFLAARIFVEAGSVAKAGPLTATLASELQAEPQAYAKIVEGGAALKNGDSRQAIKLLSEANALLDTWIGHFDLGRAYLAAGAFTQADSEFDRCLKRRGEGLSLFLDEEPTYGYVPSVYYYQGRTREELKNEGFAGFYRTYLTIRGQSTEDRLLPEVRRRLGG